MIGTGEPFVFLHGGPGMWHDELVPSFNGTGKFMIKKGFQGSVFKTLYAFLGETQ